MKKLWTALCVAPLLLASAAALAQAHSDKQTKEDIERHRAMAAAHEAAAKCLEGGKGEAVHERAAGGLQKPGHRKILRHEARALMCVPPACASLSPDFFAD